MHFVHSYGVLMFLPVFIVGDETTDCGPDMVNCDSLADCVPLGKCPDPDLVTEDDAPAANQTRAGHFVFGLVDRFRERFNPPSFPSLNPSTRDNFNPSSRPGQQGDNNLAGLIMLHGLGVSMGPQVICSTLVKSRLGGLGLSDNTLVRCPAAKRRPVGVIPPTFVPGLQFVRSWFNFNLMPAMSVFSPIPGESKRGLDRALRIVEGEIEDLMSRGVPSKNIVVGGLSQGGVLTLYTAMHTKYKLGGFLPIVAWYPRLQSEPLSSLPLPVNQHTPILHMNGMMDFIVPVFPAGRSTEREMKKVFTQYEFKAIPGTTHMTTAPNPITMPIIKKWLKQHTNLKFK